MKSILATVVLVALAAGAGAAPIDPTADGIGIYFDTGATQFCTTAAQGAQLTAYLCLTNASDTSNFLSWEAAVECSQPTALIGYTLTGDAFNHSVAPDFIVSFGTPLPYQQSTVLAEIAVSVVWEWTIAFRVWPASADDGGYYLPVYTTTAEPSVYKPLQYLWGWGENNVPNWTASINDPNCENGPSTPAETETWSGVKALYR